MTPELPKINLGDNDSDKFIILTFVDKNKKKGSKKES